MTDVAGETTIVCKSCGVEYPATTEFFGKAKTCRLGLRNTCRECRRPMLRQYQKAYYHANTQKVAEINLRSRMRDPNLREKRRRWGKAWKERNPERFREVASAKCRRWAKRNPDVVAAVDARRRARVLSAEGSFTAAGVRAIYDIQEGSCFYCDTPLFGKYHVDHWVPIARGGSNDENNIVVSCPGCNVRKHSTLPHEFIRSRRPTSTQTTAGQMLGGR